MNHSSIAKPGIVLKIQKELMSGQLDLPVLPDIAVKIKTQINNPNISMRKLASYIEAEPALTAHIMCVANSPLFMGVEKARVLHTAMTRIGLQSVSNLAFSYCTKSLFKPRKKTTTKLLKDTWQQSTYCAALSAILAKHCKLFDPDRVLLAGLMQDIGTLPIVDKLSDYPDVLEDPSMTSELIQRYSSQVGVQILSNWHFDDDIIEVVRAREDWQRDKQPDPDLADIVNIARLHSYIGTERARQLPCIDTLPAFRKLPCGELSPDQSLEILKGARQEVAEIQKLLG